MKGKLLAGAAVVVGAAVAVAVFNPDLVEDLRDRIDDKLKPATESDAQSSASREVEDARDDER